MDAAIADLEQCSLWQLRRNKLLEYENELLLSPAFIKLPNVVKNRAHIISRVMEIAENKNDIILYAE
jgi:type I restriction enzyme, R subunit